MAFSHFPSKREVLMNNPGEGPHYPGYNDPGIAIGGKYPARQSNYFCWIDSK